MRRRDGSVWLAALREGLWRVADGRAENVMPPAPRGAVVTWVWADDRDRLWIAANSSLWIEDHGFREVRARDDLRVSPSRFIRTLRVDCAAELLRQGTGSVTAVAYAVGLESLSYSGRAYRERFGVPPSENLAAESAT